MPLAEARIPITDHSFLAGDAAFETFGIENGIPVAFSRHMTRLRQTLSGLGLRLPLSDRTLSEALLALVRANRGRCDWIRLTVSAGDGPFLTERGEGIPRTVLAGGVFGPRTDSIPVVTVPWVRNERGVLAGLKTTSYAENTVALAYARSRGAGEAIFANTRGELCEGTGSNIFVVLDSQLVTPPLSTGCLQGVTRDLVLSECEAAERSTPMEALIEATEAFITSSTRGVLPISSIDGRSLPLGPVTVKARDAYRSLIQRNPDP